MPCHLVPKYLPLNEDRKCHQNPASYCLSTTCGTSHEGNNLKIVSKLYTKLDLFKWLSIDISNYV